MLQNKQVLFKIIIGVNPKNYKQNYYLGICFIKNITYNGVYSLGNFLVTNPTEVI